MFNRSRLNLAYWFALSMGSILIAFTGVVYTLEADDKLQDFDEKLYLTVKDIDNRTYYRPDQGDWLLAKGTTLVGENSLSPQNELLYVRWYNRNWKLIQFVGSTHDLKPVMEPKKRFETIYINGVAPSQQAIRQLTVPIRYNKRVVGYIQAATPLNPLQADLNRTLVILTLGVPVTLGIIGLTGWILGGIAMQPIRQSYERLQRFTADASHELRNPLAAILSNAQVALIPNLESGSQEECVKEIETAAKAMGGLIEDLLFLARHEGPINGAALIEQISVGDLLKPLVDYGRTQAFRRNRTFVHDIPNHTATVKVNAQLLRRALTNLLDNAFKYTKDDGMVQLRLQVQANHVLIQVEDDGVGIPEADLLQIFERFYRVDAARSRHTGGFGLGLSIAQQVVRAHNGQITATSTVGKGSNFQVQLPLN
ncbi:HAMP domain-containing sensor histidine kinase [Leptothoe sp. LEGE 181152]|uniref:histidine kinase n=1 Tax=Adonisia turfae CCMR0081 TaxID=2292702 RepID=A0A6M0RMM3_9CYAN|nr:HAMP domain-containing sensor histidine kinase [Adonisia turfae]MDV3349125.1 HAMP domain-containing sensor histidine kinase [Leptothoe sp. LEGE 181152]NEZ57032.1 sensor histidine kinase [Adonisia turfae CCMR0081]